MKEENGSHALSVPGTQCHEVFCSSSRWNLALCPSRLLLICKTLATGRDRALREQAQGHAHLRTCFKLLALSHLQSRASAIDNLHKALHDVGDKSQLLPGLPRFVAFLVTLVADPNFKIAISSMQILSDLVGIAGPDIEPHLRYSERCHRVNGKTTHSGGSPYLLKYTYALLGLKLQRA
eukprot:1161585-Pelagomonas_calceolata.AAC.27